MPVYKKSWDSFESCFIIKFSGMLGISAIHEFEALILFFLPLFNDSKLCTQTIKTHSIRPHSIYSYISICLLVPFPDVCI